MDIIDIQTEIDRLLPQRDALLREVILIEGQIKAYSRMIDLLKSAEGKES